MFEGMPREKLIKIKKVSLIGIVIGLILSAISLFTFKEADDALIKLDEGRLDQPMQ